MIQAGRFQVDKGLSDALEGPRPGYTGKGFLEYVSLQTELSVEDYPSPV